MLMDTAKYLLVKNNIDKIENIKYNLVINKLVFICIINLINLPNLF